MGYENEEIELVRKINESAKEFILVNIQEMADLTDSKKVWNKDEILEFVQKYFDVLNSIDTYAGASENHHDNKGLVYFDFSPDNLAKINVFLKQKVIPRLEKNEEKTGFSEKDKKQLEKFIKQLKEAVIFGEIYKAGSYKQKNA
ncbi:MAG: hypothetical protein WCV55_00620 [Candidatus Paceibacterota bacterium]